VNINHEDIVQDDLATTFFGQRPRLITFLRNIGAKDDAEDILQEAWIKIAALGDFVPDEPHAYLFRMLHNLVLDRRRGSTRSARRDSQWAEVTSAAFPDVSDEPGGERRLIAAQELNAVLRTLDALGEPTASIIRRHRIEGATQRVIAREFSMGLSTVEKHLRKAYRALLLFRSAHDEA
jgi:RNA polymerase sigma-70 factor (ECF subfamily)